MPTLTNIQTLWIVVIIITFILIVMLIWISRLEDKIEKLEKQPVCKKLQEKLDPAIIKEKSSLGSKGTILGEAITSMDDQAENK